VGTKTLIFDVKDAKFFSRVGQGKKATYEENADGIKALKVGAAVALLRETKDGKEVVTEVKMIDTVQTKKKRNQIN
jgi:hypothetical protein